MSTTVGEACEARGRADEVEGPVPPTAVRLHMHTTTLWHELMYVALEYEEQGAWLWKLSPCSRKELFSGSMRRRCVILLVWARWLALPCKSSGARRYNRLLADKDGR